MLPLHTRVVVENMLLGNYISMTTRQVTQMKLNLLTLTNPQLFLKWKKTTKAEATKEDNIWFLHTKLKILHGVRVNLRKTIKQYSTEKTNSILKKPYEIHYLVRLLFFYCWRKRERYSLIRSGKQVTSSSIALLFRCCLPQLAQAKRIL